MAPARLMPGSLMPVSITIADIMQLACFQLELTPPASFEDGSTLALDLAVAFPVARDRCLESCDWSFATEFALLPQLTSLPDTYAADPDLPFVYAYPSDARSLSEVGRLGDRWRRDAIGIRSDAPPPLRVRYAASSPNETKWPAEFRAAVAFAMASLLAPKYLAAANKQDALERRAAQALKQAMRNHANDASAERYDGLADQGDWVSEARR
jgi:hypothetical protein